MSVNLTLLTVMGALYACGIYLILERSLTRVLLGGQVFQSALIEFWLPVFGDIKFVTSTIFDTGVYIVVVGLVLDVLRSLGAEIDEHFEERPLQQAAQEGDGGSEEVSGGIPAGSTRGGTA